MAFWDRAYRVICLAVAQCLFTPGAPNLVYM